MPPTPSEASPRRWLGLSLATAVLAAAGNVIALADVERYYGGEAAVLADQAIAQDLVSLLVVAPLLAVLAWRALRGSVAAYLVWLGVLAFTVYNYAIYTLSIQFGPLFLLWVAVLGTATFALLGGAYAVDAGAVADALGRRPERVVGVFVVVVAVVFALLWLSDVVPALVDGTKPESVAEVGLPTSPVHVLDLAFFLPAAVVAGGSLLRRRPFGYAAAPAILVFFTLTGLPIIATVFVANARGHEAAWPLLAPIGVITAASAVLAWVMVRGGAPSSERAEEVAS